MTAEQFRSRREALGLSRSYFAALLGVEAADVMKCEITIPVVVQSFVRALAMAYVELLMTAESVAPESRAVGPLLGHVRNGHRTVQVPIHQEESSDVRVYTS